MRVTLNLNEKKENSEKKLSIGSIVTAKVLEFVKQSKELKIELPTKEIAFIQQNHLSDFPSHCEKIIKLRSPGSELEVLILDCK